MNEETKDAAVAKGNWTGKSAVDVPVTHTINPPLPNMTQLE